jgi:membrane-associated phospholipid phosphatase
MSHAQKNSIGRATENLPARPRAACAGASRTVFRSRRCACRAIDARRRRHARGTSGPPRGTALARRPGMHTNLSRAVSLSLAVLLPAALAPHPAQAEELAAPASAPHLPEHEHFTIDPVVDGVLVAGGLTFTELLSQIISTGEIKPTPLELGDSNKLLSIDHGAVTQTIDPNADSRSTYALYGMYAYVVADSILSGVHDGRRALLVDGLLYAESLALTSAFTLATKIGVRRPRPLDYAQCENSAGAPGCNNTDLQLSFFSGHASTAGAITGTASYLAFMRSGPRSPRPWITLGVGTLLTAFVSYERVRSGEHFPTDVIMGSLAGAGIGVLVPHFHRRPHYHESEYCAPPVIIGFSAPAPGAGELTLNMRF